MGAWIETADNDQNKYIIPLVAPHVGAWIETADNDQNKYIIPLSRPTWARGLKLAS